MGTTDYLKDNYGTFGVDSTPAGFEGYCQTYNYQPPYIPPSIVPGGWSRTAEQIRVDYWESIFDWNKTVIFALLNVVQVHILYHARNFFKLKQPKPRSRMKAWRYKR